MSLQQFISHDKSLLIAPAGYGKTYTLAECIVQTPSNEKQLVLTHTHAGIASIKEKIKKFSIPSSKYHIETITGFAQKYVLAYYCEKDIPYQEDLINYYPFIVEKAKDFFQLETVKRTIKYSYQGLFVDEYQDCTKSQHEMLMMLSKIIPIHILGDPMQGIFGFNEPLVDFDNDLNNFEEVFELTTPWRWSSEDNNKQLGEVLKEIRELLLSEQKAINLSSYYSKIDYIEINEEDIYRPDTGYRKKLNSLIINQNNNHELNSLLIIVPEYYENNIPKGSITTRSKLKAQIDYTNQLTLLEAIDNKDFYSISKNIDDLVKNISRKRKKIKSLNEGVFEKLFNKANLNEWIKDDRLINKGEENFHIKKKLEISINMFIENSSIFTFLNIIQLMKNEMKFRSKRHDLLHSIIKAMNIAICENKTVYEGMVSHKNIVRRVGRKIHGKCIGTTLLTKGLEFDTVVILNAHRFDDYKHFYVAITRACKKLVIFSEKEVLEFN